MDFERKDIVLVSSFIRPSNLGYCTYNPPKYKINKNYLMNKMQQM